ncbi:E3 ubiquitin-protein ligase MBR2 [Populus alba x Populus x berolinensis]|nr:E3 ubiquitin-protein ligase MBR2 [Populus alba x Populus x berolinensis]
MNLVSNVARISIMMIVFRQKDLACIAGEIGWDVWQQEMGMGAAAMGDLFQTISVQVSKLLLVTCLNPVDSRLSNNAVSSGDVSCSNAMTHDIQKLQWLEFSCQRSDERLFETTDILFPGRGNMGISGNQSRQSSSGVSSDDVGTSSGSSGCIVEETNGGSGSSLGGWGLSCKRKALEGTSGQSFPGASSSCFPHPENSAWHNGPNNLSVSSSLSLSTPTWNAPSVTPPEQLNPRFGYGMRAAPSDAFPSSSVSGHADTLRNFDRRTSPGLQQESAAFNVSTTGGSRRWSLQHPPRPVSVSDYLESRSPEPANSNATQGQLHAINPSALSRSMLRWNDFSSSRVGNSPSSLIPGELGAALREETNSRRFQRNNAEHPMFAPATEMRSMIQDPTRWGLATGNMSTSGSVSSTRIGPSSSVRPFPTPRWIHRNPTTHNQQRFSEFSAWSLFPPMDSEPGGHSGHFSPLSSGPSSSAQDTVISSGSNSQGLNPPFPRSALLMEEQSDDILGMPRSLRVLAADIEGRHRLISEIRQVLNAMRRGENLRVEELLALEERIGDVSTGLSRETILKLMKQQKHVPVSTESPADLEPCCICQEEYVDGDDMGIIDCGHDFHANCFKQWLMQKNLCPICKMTALIT